MNLRAYVIFASQECGETVGTLLGDACNASQAGRPTYQLYLRPGDDAPRRVSDHTGDGASRRLRIGRAHCGQRQKKKN